MKINQYQKNIKGRGNKELFIGLNFLKISIGQLFYENQSISKEYEEDVQIRNSIYIGLNFFKISIEQLF